jgi:hypothetical protein
MQPPQPRTKVIRRGHRYLGPEVDGEDTWVADKAHARRLPPRAAFHTSRLLGGTLED